MNPREDPFPLQSASGYLVQRGCKSDFTGCTWRRSALSLMWRVPWRKASPEGMDVRPIRRDGWQPQWIHLVLHSIALPGTPKVCKDDFLNKRAGLFRGSFSLPSFLPSFLQESIRIPTCQSMAHDTRRPGDLPPLRRQRTLRATACGHRSELVAAVLRPGSFCVWRPGYWCSLVDVGG